MLDRRCWHLRLILLLCSLLAVIAAYCLIHFFNKQELKAGYRLFSILLYIYPNDVGVWDHFYNFVGSRPWKALNKSTAPYHPTSRYIRRSGYHQVDNLKVLDVGSYNGDIIFYLKQLNPSWDLFGYDISKKKVLSSKKNCPECIVKQVNVFKALFSESYLKKHKKYFDFVLVSDVLYYGSWARWSPLVLNWCSACYDHDSVARDQNKFIRNLKLITKREIIVSKHQNNMLVVDMMKRNHFRYYEDYMVWSIKV